MQRVSNSNTAYDYSRFEEKEVQSKPQIQQVAKRKAAAKTVSVAKAGLYVLTAVIMLSMLIYGRAAQAELDSQYTSTLKAVNTLKDENALLQIKLESEMSLKNIEDIAKNELGLQKLNDQQIEYINFNTENKAEVLKKQSIWSSISTWFGNLFS